MQNELDNFKNIGSTNPEILLLKKDINRYKRSEPDASGYFSDADYIGQPYTDPSKKLGDIFDTIGNNISDILSIPGSILKTVDILVVGVGLILAYGVYKTLSQSSVSNIGEGVSKVVKSVK